MNRNGRMGIRAASLVVLTSTLFVAATSIAGPNDPKREPAPRPDLERGAPSPPPPPAKGWPAKVQSAKPLPSNQCNRAPAAAEVLVYDQPNFGGKCASLVGGFYPRGEYLGVGDNSVRSLKAGSAVRARLFFNPVYGGEWTPLTGDNAHLSKFENQVSSMRVEPSNRSMTCSDVSEGELALFQNPDFSGDCVVLPAAGTPNPHDHRTGANVPPDGYANAEQMGIADDSISSWINNSAWIARAYENNDWGGTLGDALNPHTKNRQLSQSSTFTTGINDHISSLNFKMP